MILAKVYNNRNEEKYCVSKPFPRKEPNVIDGYITDENKSVKWNKEQVERNKQIYNQKIQEYRDEENRIYEMFVKDIEIEASLYTDLNKQQIDLLLNKAWEEGHSEGYLEVINIMEELLTLVTDVLKLK